MTKVAIREAKKRDLPAILSLYAQADMDKGKVLFIERAKKMFDRIRNYPEYRIYVATVGEKIVGTFALLIQT